MRVKNEHKWHGRRLLAALLTLVMLLSVLPVSAMAGATYEGPNQVGTYLGYNDKGETDGNFYDTDEASVKTLETGDLVMSKTIEQTAKDTFNITLTVTTTEKVSKIPLTQDAAVVLLIDASGSMQWCASCGQDSEHAKGCKYGKGNSVTEDQKRITFAKAAAQKFVDDFVVDANGGKRMIAVGAFATNAWRVTDWTDANDKDNGAANRNALKDDIGRIATNYGTNPDAALQLASNLLDDDRVTNITSRYVILLTDGEPNRVKNETGDAAGVPGSDSKDGKTAAEAADKTAAVVKETQKATLYTMAYALEGKYIYQDTVTCEKDGWHHHNLDEGFGEGTTGRMVKEDEGKYEFDEHYDDGKLEEDHDERDGCTSGWFEDKHEAATSTGLTAEAWLERLADSGCFRKANNGESVSIGFDEISNTIKQMLQAWKVIDPMGDYISYVSGSASSTYATYDTAKKELTWDIKSEPLPTGVKKNSKTYYTYKMTYSVRLDTSAENFEDNQLYPTNKATELTYTTDAFLKDGTTPNPKPTFKTDYFNVPRVWGEKPPVNAPKLTVSKTADKETVVAGENITYTIKLKNEGTANCKSAAVVTDTLDDNLTLQADKTVAPEGTTVSVSGKTVTWTVPSSFLTVGAEVTLQLTAKVAKTATGTIKNSAIVTSPDDPNPTNDSVETTVTPLVDLTIQKAFGGDMTSAPKDFSTSFKVTNAEGNAVTGSPFAWSSTQDVVVSDLPAGIYYVEELSPTFTNTNNVYNTTPTVTFKVGGASAEAVAGNNMKVEVNLTGDKTVEVTNSYYYFDSPNVKIEKTATEKATVGDTITYKIKVKNIGGGDATGVVVTDTLPTVGLDLTTVDLTDNDDATIANTTIANGKLTWNVGTLAKVNGEATLTVKVKVAASALELDKITNTASVHHDKLKEDGSEDPKTPPAETIITKAAVTVVKTAKTYSVYDKADPTKNVVRSETGASAEVGDTIVYTLTVTNSGDAAAKDVKVIDTLPEKGLTITEIKDGGVKSADGKTITWTINELVAEVEGSTDNVKELTVIGKVDALENTSEGITLINNAKIEGGDEATPVKTVVGAITGTLTLKKTVSGDLSWNYSDLQNITFSVYTEDGTKAWEDIAYADAVADDGVVLTLAPGTYTIVENNADVTGYTRSTTVGNTEVGENGYVVELVKGDAKTVTFNNVYSSKVYRLVFDGAVNGKLLDAGNAVNKGNIAWRSWAIKQEGDAVTGSWQKNSTGSEGAASQVSYKFTQSDYEVFSGSMDPATGIGTMPKNVTAQADPGYAWTGEFALVDNNGEFVRQADDSLVTYSSLAQAWSLLQNASENYVRLRKNQSVVTSDGLSRVVTDYYEVRFKAVYVWDLDYTFNDFGSEHVDQMGYWTKGTSDLVTVTDPNFGDQLIRVTDQMDCKPKTVAAEGEKVFQPVIFFVKPEAGYTNLYIRTKESATLLDSVQSPAAGVITKMTSENKPDFVDDDIWTAALADYSYFFVYTDDGFNAAGEFVNPEYLNRYFKVVATRNPVCPINVTKTVVQGQGGNQAPGSKEFTFHLLDAQDNNVSTARVTITGFGSKQTSFTPIEFRQAGTYTYTVKEDGKSAGSWTYDESTHTVVIEVVNTGATTEDPSDDVLVIDSVTVDGGDPLAEGEIANVGFTNTYTKYVAPKEEENGDGDEEIKIPDDPTPLAPLPELPEEPEVEIPEEEIPLAPVPKTGDASALWLALTALSGTGLAGVAVLGRKKREEED